MVWKIEIIESSIGTDFIVYGKHLNLHNYNFCHQVVLLLRSDFKKAGETTWSLLLNFTCHGKGHTGSVFAH